MMKTFCRVHPTLKRAGLWAGLLLLWVSAGLAQTQQPKQVPQNPKQQQKLKITPQMQSPHSRQMIDLRRRLIELDRLLSLESVGRAEGLLKDLEQHRSLAKELVSRRIRLAQLKGEHDAAVDICRDAIMDQPLNSALWRSLATSLLAVDKPDSARMALDMFIRTSPNQRSGGMVAVELLQMSGRPEATIVLIDSLRVVLPEPHFMGRQKAISLLKTGRQEEAADAVVAELRFNPFNLSLLRNDLLENGYEPGSHQAFMNRLTELIEEEESKPAETVLLANLLLTEGDTEAALGRVVPLLGRRSALLSVLQNSVALGQELAVLEDPAQVQSMVDYLLVVLEEMCGPVNPDPGLRHRAADYLAMVCERGLEKGALGEDPQAAAERYGKLLATVRRINPSSQYLYSSQIKLARYTRDVLGKPKVAASRLERMLLDLDLPTEGVALTRLTLGECYLAAGDTARGRTVLTRLGRDPQFRQVAGHAHYHLARLDLAEGHFATAQDRFAVVAMDNPAAPYANDSLDLGLAIVEEMDNPSGGPAIMQFYARSVYYDLVAKPDLQLEALEHFVEQAALRVDPEDKQYLLERGRFELAEAYYQAGKTERALDWLTEVIRKHPDGRYPGPALFLKARILNELGREDEARLELEQLLAQYPDYLFIDDVRDKLRNLP